MRKKSDVFSIIGFDTHVKIKRIITEFLGTNDVLKKPLLSLYLLLVKSIISKKRWNNNLYLRIILNIFFIYMNMIKYK